jgi:CheY-like chemotaxis protein
MGLGLTITKLLVEIMGGEISVTSTPGRGSQFRIKLLLAHVADARPPAKTQERIVGYLGKRKLILIVDDDTDHRELIKEALEPVSFSIISAPDGPSALTIAEECAPDLFILDISMPGMSGWHVAKRLREIGHTAPILMMSANIGDQAPRSDEEPAHDAALSKPVDMQTLLNHIQKLLSLRVVTANSAPEYVPPARDIKYASRPDRRHIEELTRLGEIGFVSGIEAKLDELEASGNGSIVFIKAARERIRAFDLRGYMTLLAQPVEPEHADE